MIRWRSTDVTCRCRIWFGCARIMPVSGLRQASFHSHGHGNSGHWNDSNIKIGSCIHDLTFWTRLKLRFPQDELFALKNRKSCLKYYFLQDIKPNLHKWMWLRNIHVLHDSCLNLCIYVHDSDARTSLFEFYLRNVISYVKHKTK